MTAAMCFQAWSDTLITTAALVLLVLLIRKPFARHFGPTLAYSLWAVPALRLMLPPLPFADPVVVNTATPSASASDMVVYVAAESTAAPTAAPLWSLADALPVLFVIWAVGMVAVLVAAIGAHYRFRREVLAGAVELDPIGNIRLMMTDAVDGPVAFGLLRRFIVVPHDFFARYQTEERALAVDHEIAHHRHGDLWANSAALLLLAVQWFNPFAWRAIQAFRFDQEAACDARVLLMTDSAPRALRTARYATAIAKAAVGSRLTLAAPMAVHDNLQARLTMLTQQDISKNRGLVGRLLVGGAALAILATTATLIPAGVASASVQDSAMLAPPVPPAPPSAAATPSSPAAPEAPRVEHRAQRVMVFTSEEDGEGAAAGAGSNKHEVHRIVIREGGDGDTKAITSVHDDAKAMGVAFRMPNSLSRDDILAALKEKGIKGAKAEAIADKLEAKRNQAIALAPMPPMPPLPPMPQMAWSSGDGKAFALARCNKGEDRVPLISRDDVDGKKHSRVVMVHCGNAADMTAQLAALRKVRAQFAEGHASKKMSDEIRAKVIADIDRSIAEIEKSDH